MKIIYDDLGGGDRKVSVLYKYGAESFFFLIIPTLLFPSLVVKWALTSSTDNRSCRCRKAAGEESPGFTGQDAG